MEDIINLHQGGMTLQEYILKFIQFSKYASSLVSNTRDEMSHLVTGVSDYLLEECPVEMLHDNMDLSCFMVHS